MARPTDLRSSEAERLPALGPGFAGASPKWRAMSLSIPACSCEGITFCARSPTGQWRTKNANPQNAARVVCRRKLVFKFMGVGRHVVLKITNAVRVRRQTIGECAHECQST